MSNELTPSGPSPDSPLGPPPPVGPPPSDVPPVDTPFQAQVVQAGPRPGVPPGAPPGSGPGAPPWQPPAAPQISSDENNLNLLSTFHYVAAALVGLMPCLTVFHLGFGIAILTGQFPDKNPPPPALGWIFVAVPLFFMTIGWSVAALMVTAGRRLRQRRSHTFCMVIAGISCIFMPWGTALGVFTIIVLSKPTVKALFGVGPKT